MKKIFRFLMCGMLLAGFAACSDDDPEPEPKPQPGTQLAKPQLRVKSVDTNTFTVEWNAVNGASSYAYTVNSEAEQKTTSTQVSRADLTPETDYTVKVKAVAEGYTASEWATITVKTTGGDSPEKKAYTLTVPDDKLSSFRATVHVAPSDKKADYFCTLIEKAQWNDDITAKDVADDVKNQLGENIGYLYQLLKNKDQDITFMTSPETAYVALAFSMDADGNVVEDMETVEFSTKTAETSSSKIDVTFDGVKESGFTLVVKTDPAFTGPYSILIVLTSEIDAYVAQNGEMALMSFVDAQGTQVQGSGQLPLTGLPENSSFTVCVFAIDKDNKYFFGRFEQSTTAEPVPARIESDLFSDLVGKWSATQKVRQYEEGGKSSDVTMDFSVEIVASVADYDHDYRKYNQLVAQMTNYAGYEYYGVKDLIKEGFDQQSAEMTFGPKLILKIQEGDKIAIDGQFIKSVFGWLGEDVFMVNADPQAMKMNETVDLEAVLSSDKNTLTIKGANEGYYPTAVTIYTDVVLMGLSDIVLTRTGNAPAQCTTSMKSNIRPVRPAMTSYKIASRDGKVRIGGFADKVLGKWNREPMQIIPFK